MKYFKPIPIMMLPRQCSLLWRPDCGLNDQRFKGTVPSTDKSFGARLALGLSKMLLKASELLSTMAQCQEREVYYSSPRTAEVNW